MNLPTVIRPAGENSFDSIYNSISFWLPDSEKVTLYVHRPHIIVCSVDPRKYRGNVEVYGGKYLSAPIHSIDIGGLPRDVGTMARQLAKGEISLEGKFLDEVKTVVSFDRGIGAYFSYGYGATGYHTGSLQIVKPYLLATSSVSREEMSSMGTPKMFAFNFLSDYGRDKRSRSKKEEKLNELPGDVRKIAETLLKAAKRNGK